MRRELDYVAWIISKSVTDVQTILEIPIEFVGKFRRASSISMARIRRGRIGWNAKSRYTRKAEPDANWIMRSEINAATCK